MRGLSDVYPTQNYISQNKKQKKKDKRENKTKHNITEKNS